MQAIVYPGRAMKMRVALRASAVLTARTVRSQKRWHALAVSRPGRCRTFFGGYSGHLRKGGGRDRLVSHETSERNHMGMLCRQLVIRISMTVT